MPEYEYRTPGEIISNYFKSDPSYLSIKDAASKLGVHAETLRRIMKDKRRVTAKFAVKFEEIFNEDAETLLARQSDYDIWKIKNNKGKINA